MHFFTRIRIFKKIRIQTDPDPGYKSGSGSGKKPGSVRIRIWHTAPNRHCTVDIVEMQLPAQHQKGPEGQAEAQRTRQVTVTWGIDILDQHDPDG